MPTVITRDMYLEINGVPLSTPAWWIAGDGLTALYGLVVRGSDRLLPSVDGMLAYRRRVTSRVIGLPILVVGSQDHEGASNGDVYAGLDDNIDYLMANVITPDTGTKSAVWHRANGDVEAEIHVEGFEAQAWGRGWVRFTLELSIPAGVFTPVVP